MILPWLFIIPMLGGVVAWLAGRWNVEWARWAALAAMAANLALSLWIWVASFAPVGLPGPGPWLIELNVPWIPQLGIEFHLAIDGLSLLLVNLTNFVGLMIVVTSWREARERVGFYYMNLLSVMAGMIAVFIAIDLFLFYFCWEMMLIPMYFLFMWGHEGRWPAAIKFFLFTQLSGLLMLLSILGLYFVHGQATGVFTFDYNLLLGTNPDGVFGIWLMLGFFVAFAVKLPVVPFHTWLPDAYTQAPTAGTVVLSALMAKTAGYGLIRFLIPLFPYAAFWFAPVALALAVTGILYGALLAYGQRDLKRLIAYSSVSHMGFVLLGIFAWNQYALQGAILEMVAHGISTGALFLLAGAIEARLQTRDMLRMGGLWSAMPWIGGTTLLFALASIGLPGLGNFVAEFLILVGTFRVSIVYTALASLGIVGGVIYALWMIQKVFQGGNEGGWRAPDMRSREVAAMALMVGVIFWLGLYPQTELNAAAQAIGNLNRYVPLGTISASGDLTGGNLGMPQTPPGAAPWTRSSAGGDR